MKYTILLILTILLQSSVIFGQNEGPIINDLGSRVPELPQTFPIRIAIDPIKATKPVPEAPPTIAFPDPNEPPHHDSIRNVYFVHGFGGDRSRWTAAREASQDPFRNKQGFKARKLEGYAPEYVENGRLNVAAQDLAVAISQGADHQEEDFRQRNFIIGHSQGGILGRYLVFKDYSSDSPFYDPFISKDQYGGLVTFCSALNGAQLVNNREAGMIEQVADHACDVVKELVTSGLIANIIEFFIVDEDGNESGGQDLCDVFSGDLLPLFFSGLSQPISLDYLVGSPTLNRVNSDEAPGISKVAFYGIEPYEAIEGAQFYNPIFYRTVQHFFTDVNIHGTWEANNDDELAIQASEMAENQFLDFRKKKSRAQLFFALGKPILAYNAWDKAKAHRGMYYLYHDLDDFWMGIIGANGLEYITTTHSDHTCECVFEGPNVYSEFLDDVETEAACTLPGASLCIFDADLPHATTHVIEFFEKPSDGVVLQESAQYMVGATHPSEELRIRYGDTGVQNELNTGSSHMQARNDRNTRDALRALYDGDLGIYFRTAIK